MEQRYCRVKQEDTGGHHPVLAFVFAKAYTVSVRVHINSPELQTVNSEAFNGG